MSKKSDNRAVMIAIIVVVVVLFGALAYDKKLDDLGRLVTGWLS